MVGRLVTVFLLALAGFCAIGSAHADVVFPRGSRIGIEPPPGFSPSQKIMGFEDASRGAAISLLDLPPPAYEAFERSAFAGADKRLTVEKRELFPFRDGLGFLVTAREEVNGTEHRSWYLLVNAMTKEAGHVAALIAVREPEAATAAYPDRSIRAALATVSFRNPPVEETLGMLPFKLTKLAGFRISKVIPQGGTVVLTEGSGDDLGHQPYMVVSIGRGAPEANELRSKFAENLLAATPLPGFAITSAEPMRINNQQGFELRAKATADGKPVALVQWLRFGGSGVFTRVVGVVDAGRWDELFPRFREVRDGIDRQ